MITLYKYLRESIFDDDEDISKDSDIDILNNTLIKELGIQLSKTARRATRFNDSMALPIELKNGELNIDWGDKTWSSPEADLEFRVENNAIHLLKAIKKQAEIDTINAPQYYFDIRHGRVDPDIFGKNIHALSLWLYDVSYVNDMNFIINHDQGRGNADVIMMSNGNLDIKNVNIDTVPTQRNNRRPMMITNVIPSISNCKFNGITKLIMRDSFIFDWDKTKQILDKFFDDKHIAYFEDIKSHETKPRSSKFAKLRATVNNKKLHFVSSDNGKMFNIAKGAKLSDIIDIKAFPDLVYITLESDRLIITFSKTTIKDDYFNKMELPNDPGWVITIERLR
jgi:hypothetical protein